MAINSTHPEYNRYSPDWLIMRDTYAGERTVKGKGSAYLPPTSGQRLDGLGQGQPGADAYAAYVSRAKFPDYVHEAVTALLGAMHHKPPEIQLPARMQGLMERATPQGEGLAQLLERVNREQLLTGRLGLLLDVPSGRDVTALPYLSLYCAEAVLNWNDHDDPLAPERRLTTLVLDESSYEQDRDLEWWYRNKYRVLRLTDEVYETTIATDETNLSIEGLEYVTPSIAGRVLGEIPFDFVNVSDLSPDPDRPPLMGLARLALTIYRAEADYRQSLFMQGQDTLVITASSDDDGEVRVGAGAVLRVPIGGKAEFIGVSSSGLEEQRQSLENDRMEASQRGGRLLESSLSRERESGEALKIRSASQTTNLTQIAVTGARALQSQLRRAALWMGLDPREVLVIANQDFQADTLVGKELVQIMTAKSLGAPISQRSIHDLMRGKELTNRTFEEEMDLISEEVPLGFDPADLGGDQEDLGNPAPGGDNPEV